MGGYCPWPLFPRLKTIMGIEVLGNIVLTPCYAISTEISFPLHLKGQFTSLLLKNQPILSTLKIFGTLHPIPLE
jgi:hypothetical protein